MVRLQRRREHPKRPLPRSPPPKVLGCRKPLPTVDTDFLLQCCSEPQELGTQIKDD